MKTRPLQDRLLVARIEADDKTPGGLFIPDNAKEKPQMGVVKAVGKGRIREDGSVQPLDVKVGDKILFGKYSGTDMKVLGSDLLIMREDDILAIIE